MISSSPTPCSNRLRPLISLAVLAGLIVPAVVRAKKNRLLSFAIFWFLGNLALESSVLGLEIIFEHRLYLPSMMLSLALAALLFGRLQIRPALIIASCLSVVLLAWTYDRNQVWADEVRLWLDCAAKSPASARSHNNLGLALARRGLYREAAGHYREALRLRPANPLAHNNLGLALGALGRDKDAMEQYREALKFNPDYAAALNNLGRALRRLGRTEESIRLYRRALEIEPGSAEVHNNLGVALAVGGRHEEAIQHFRQGPDPFPRETKTPAGTSSGP